ncbi:hypothetical protein PLESTM_000262200 [Pleodorina starrii]|nr:hypothetical protein PLESTM_000262200 [Pleodorina starrii]
MALTAPPQVAAVATKPAQQQPPPTPTPAPARTAPLAGLKLLLHSSLTESWSDEQLRALQHQLLGRLGAASVVVSSPPQTGRPQQVTHVLVDRARLLQRPQQLTALAHELQPALQAIQQAHPALELTAEALGARMRAVDGSWLQQVLQYGRRMPAAPHSVPPVLEAASRLWLAERRPRPEVNHQQQQQQQQPADILQGGPTGAAAAAAGETRAEGVNAGASAAATSVTAVSHAAGVDSRCDEAGDDVGGGRQRSGGSCRGGGGAAAAAEVKGQAASAAAAPPPPPLEEADAGGPVRGGPPTKALRRAADSDSDAGEVAAAAGGGGEVEKGADGGGGDGGGGGGGGGCVGSLTVAARLTIRRQPSPLPGPRPAADAPLARLYGWLGEWRPELNRVSMVSVRVGEVWGCHVPPPAEFVLYGIFDAARCSSIGNGAIDGALRDLVKYEEALAGPRDNTDRAAGAPTAHPSTTAPAPAAGRAVASGSGLINHQALNYAHAAAVVRAAAFRITADMSPQRLQQELPYIGPFTARIIQQLTASQERSGGGGGGVCSCEPLEAFRADQPARDSRGRLRPGTEGASTRRMFCRLPGCGPVLARQWWEQGFRTFEQLQSYGLAARREEGLEEQDWVPELASASAAAAAAERARAGGSGGIRRDVRRRRRLDGAAPPPAEDDTDLDEQDEQEEDGSEKVWEEGVEAEGGGGGRGSSAGAVGAGRRSAGAGGLNSDAETEPEAETEEEEEEGTDGSATTEPPPPPPQPRDGARKRPRPGARRRGATATTPAATLPYIRHGGGGRSSARGGGGGGGLAGWWRGEVWYSLLFREHLGEVVAEGEVAEMRRVLINALGSLSGCPGWELLQVGGGRRGRATEDVDFLATHPHPGNSHHCHHRHHQRPRFGDAEPEGGAGGDGGGGGGGAPLVVRLYQRLVAAGRVVPLERGFCRLQVNQEAGYIDAMRRLVATGRWAGQEQMDRYDHLWCIWITGSGRRRRLDVMFVPYGSQWPYAVVGWTGSKQYLRFMRQHALNCGMFTNSHATLRTTPSGVRLVPEEALPTDSEGREFRPPRWHERGAWEQEAAAAAAAGAAAASAAAAGGGSEDTTQSNAADTATEPVLAAAGAGGGAVGPGRRPGPEGGVGRQEGGGSGSSNVTAAAWACAAGAGAEGGGTGLRPVASERDITELLRLPYRQPHERNA